MISNRYKFCFSFISMMLISLCVFGAVDTALAQEKLDVRASNKSDYSRLVFDWKSGAKYSVEKQSSALVISFKEAVEANISGVDGIKNIGSVSVLSSKDENLKISVSIPKGSKYRHFKIGKRIIIDVYNSNGKLSREAPKVKKTEIKEPKKAPEKAVVEENVDAPPRAELESSAPNGDLALERNPHVITMSSTRNVGVAVFERAGYLWIIQDDPSLQVPPTISGPNKDELGEFEEIKITAGKAYRLLKPKGASFYGEGSGLLWRVVMSPNPRNKKPVKMETKELKELGSVTRSIFWPLGTAKKVLTLKDPLVGDEIKIVTVGDSAQTIGSARQMVDMQVLTSIIGLAVVPHIDDLDIKVEDNGVSLSQAMGMAVSPLSDTESLVLRDDIEKEDALFDKIDNPRHMTKIFDFARWEMGGKNALLKNRRILMVSMGSKQGTNKVEDLITIAKLNLANDRGPEALGLLRVVEQELPGLDETPEFIALRGAAAVLSSKYDEAIEDLTDTSIQRYDEINYWKAAALAGLEDWQQADKTMPAQFHLLEKYPSQIKQPLTLALTEVALRAGNINIAENLLSMLEGEFENMSLPRQSAWKYLQGEMERQSGNHEQALQNWDTLLTGKDDYFRAKAGLSVTRMQLERQKITPAKAIDRLEGLRYAWRGDELETIINYRLGQVYIDNKNYLKGLSVLRNAVGLSPHSKISQEVTDYMTQTFRDLFTDGTLESVSPLDAVSIYEEFKELTPVGTKGDVFVQNLAERLVSVDLLGRAAALLENQMNYRLKGNDKIKVAIRLAAIKLLDDKPDGALHALDVAKSEAGSSQFAREINMLRARALSDKGEANKALSMLRGLSGSERLARLRADISWNGGLWNDAANAFKSLIAYENISLTRPMEEYHENLVLNRSIALNLSGNRTALASLRDTYGQLMAQSKKARIFNLVTRPRKLGILEDRESVTSLISEVDLFGDFLENYKGSK